MAGEMWTLQKTPLGDAIAGGDAKFVKKLIHKGENPLYQDRKGNTYLHYVCTMYKPYVINILLAAGVPINTKNKFGNTALHVTALHSECCHVPDLMQCGIDPYAENNDGKTAADIAKSNTRWIDLYTKYEPTLRVAIQRRDMEAIDYMFRCWPAVHLHVDIQNNRNTREYAAGLTSHDIVTMVDHIRFTLMAVYAIKELDHKQLEYALSRGPAICDVNFLHQVDGGHPHHMLQHAIRLKDYTMVDMLLEAGADVNVNVFIHEYVKGPLYFEVIQKDNNLDMKMIRKLFAYNIDLNARDERGRSALVYCIDRRHGRGDATLEMVQTLLDKGINIAMRDDTGCTARDVALFSRRRDIVSSIDQHLVEKIRSEDIDTLIHLAMDNYRDIFINYSNRDTWIYAAGNETDDVTDFLVDIKEYWTQMEKLHLNIIQGDLNQVHNVIKGYPDRQMLLKSKDMGGRGPLLLAVLYNRLDIAEYLYKMDSNLIKNAKDNNGRSVWHFISCLPEHDRTEFNSLFGSPHEQYLDVSGKTPDDLYNGQLNFINEERKRSYGMEREVHCMNKYEVLISVIKSKDAKLKHFNSVLSTLSYPVSDFHKYFHPQGHPLVTDYKDLLHLAVDQRKQDIAEKLVRCRVDCSVVQEYETEDGRFLMTPEQRASSLGLHDLAQYIHDKGVYICR